MKRICQSLGAILMTFGLEPAAASYDPTGTCPSIGAVETQFSSTCDSCVVTDGTKTIDQDETTYGTLQIVGAGSGTMRATAQGGVVFPAGSQVGIQHSIHFTGDVEMLLRTYEKDVLQEEFAIEDSPISFKTTRPYDAVEFGVSQFDPGVSGALPTQCGYAPPTNCTPSPHEVEARIHEFCTGPDTTPDAFAFSEQAGVEPGTLVTSAPVTITGIEAPAAISAGNGWYSVGCTETYVAAAGSISNGQTVCVRHWAAWEFGGGNSTSLTVGGVYGWFSSRTRAADGTPGAFTFSDQTGVEPGATVKSDAVTIAGIEAPASISVTGGEYSIGCTASFTSAGGTIANDETVCVRHTAGSFGETTTTTLTVGGVADAFSSTVRAADTTPDAFSFVDQDGVAIGTTIKSDSVTIGGIEQAVPISISGGAYSIGCSGTFTSTAGSITSGQTVCVRHTAAGSHGTATDTTLTVGGISDTFTSTTAAAPAAPAQGGGGGAPSPWLLGLLAAVATLRRRQARLIAR